MIFLMKITGVTPKIDDSTTPKPLFSLLLLPFSASHLLSPFFPTKLDLKPHRKRTKNHLVPPTFYHCSTPFSIFGQTTTLNTIRLKTPTKTSGNNLVDLFLQQQKLGNPNLTVRPHLTRPIFPFPS